MNLRIVIFWCYILVTAPVFGNSDWVAFFDGKSLSIRQNNQVILTLPATAGRPFFQNPMNQYLKNKGPLPEGNYLIDLEHTIFFNQPGIARHIKWFTRYIAWGNLAIPLIPDSTTNLKGRHSFMIHGGGWLVGSKGCVVVYWRDKTLYQYMLKAPHVPIRLVVDYK